MADVKFVEDDFAVFERRKQTDSRYNDSRRQVREKMKIIESELTPKLVSRGIVLNPKISLSSINPIYKKRVDGIWIAYTSSLRRYFETPQLNCGIFENGFFVGIEIPLKNRKAQLSFVDVCVDMPELIETVSDKLQTGIGTFVVYLHGSKSNNLLELNEKLLSKSHWVSIGVDIPKNESILTSKKLGKFLLTVLETLYPLYLSICGIESLFSLIHLQELDERTLEYTAKLSINNQMPNVNITDVNNLIQERNARNSSVKAKLKQRGRSRERDLVLSTLVKVSRGDRCQLCGIEYELDGRFFCEVHHIVPLSRGGLDQSANMVVVCPNHHKILDALGSDIIKKSKNSLTIEVGNEQYSFNI